jgi:hypothetical protein
VTETRGQFGNPEERELLPWEAVTRGLVKEQLNEKICVVVNRTLCRSMKGCGFICCSYEF